MYGFTQVFQPGSASLALYCENKQSKIPNRIWLISGLTQCTKSVE